jgi:hypothetical protein
MQIRWAYLKRVLAGAIFGLYIANLLYFLNPQVDITPGHLLLVTVVYGVVCGLLFGSALWGLRALRVRLWGRPDEYRTHGFGFVVLAAFIAAAIYWIHLEVFRIYLPVGAVRVLQKATNAITVTAFVLLLLWVLERNADRKRSRLIFVAGVAVIALSSIVLYERRDSYRTEKQRVVVANIGTVAGQRPVLFVAIRNLPYDWIVQMIGEGRLPFFEQARSRAYFTRLEPFPTMDAKALWASIATGKLPFRHGVTGRFAYRTLLNRDPEDRFLIVPSGVGFKAWGLIPPVQRISTQLPSGDSLPLWTLFERVGLRAAVVDWPSSDATGAAVVVTDDFFDGSNGNRMREVSPRTFEPQAERLLQQPSGAMLQRFAGAAADRRTRIGAALGADLSAIAITRIVAPNRTFALDAVALNGFEDAQRAIHIFTNELPPKNNVKGEVARAYAEQLDRLLASLAHDFPDHLIVVVSPSGPVPPTISATPYEIVRDVLVADDPGADDGFVLIGGAGVAHRDNPEAARAEDVVPTILYAAGLPVARDMDGRVLTDAFDEEVLRRTPLSVVQTYEAKQLVVRRGG